jgi:predicted ATPase/DNA-binding winged helix-turn-helix (wHTH) protein
MQLSVAGLRFGRFELQPHERRLLVDGAAAPLGARALDVLIALAERAGSLVSKHELMDLVWPDVIVEENNLQAQVSALRKVLGVELIATIPGRGYRFTARVERVEGSAAAAPGLPALASTREAAPPPARSAPETSLAASGLLGRDSDLHALDRAFGAHRLVTLVGPGGVGKTVLAQAYLAGVADRHEHGGYLVRLASLSDGASIPGAINEALELKPGGGDPIAALAGALRPRAMLIVLDNAEHLVGDVAALAARLLRDCPLLQILATSQMPLEVLDEQVLRLEPLPVPRHGMAAAQALDYGAVALFAQRAREADRRFALDDAKVETVVAICRALDGLPLALEMCAARWPVLGLRGLRDSLEQRFRVLTGGHRDAPQRQRTLRAALDWSHELLDEDERTVFRRLGVFTGGFQLDAATEVASDQRLDRWAVIDQLASLVARSLVAVSADDPPRYQLPETMRAYALERLAESGEDGVRARHARAMESFFREAYRLQMEGVGSDELRTRSEAEFDNAREAFAWSLRHDHATAVSLAAHAARFTAFSARRSEALRWLADCEGVIDEGIAADVRALWWTELARFRLFYRDPKAADAARAALALYAALGDEFGQFNAYGALVRSHLDETPETREAVQTMQGLIARHPEWPAIARLHAAGVSAIAANLAEDYELAKHFRREEARLAAEAGNPFAMHAAQTNVVAILRAQSLWHEAIALARELFNQLRHGGELVNAAYAGLHLVACLVLAEQLAEAALHASDAWMLARRIDLPLMGDTAALLAARQGRPRAAAKLLGHALGHYAARGFPTAGEPDDNIARVEAVTRASLDPVTHDSLLALGAKMSDAQVLALIRSERDE